MTQLQIDKGMRVRLLYTSSRYLRPLIGQKGTVIDIDEPIGYEYGTFIRDNGNILFTVISADLLGRSYDINKHRQVE